MEYSATQSIRNSEDCYDGKYDNKVGRKRTVVSKCGEDHGGNQTGSEGEWFLSISWPQSRSGAHGGGTKSSGSSTCDLPPPRCGLLGARGMSVANVATKGPWSVLQPEATWMTMDHTASKGHIGENGPHCI